MKHLITLLAVMSILGIRVSDADARIKRSTKAKHAFEKTTPCPSTGQQKGSCPGYIIDHIIPLACGGADAPSNMQWQTIQDAKTKDNWERKDCGK